MLGHGPGLCPCLCRHLCKFHFYVKQIQPPSFGFVLISRKVQLCYALKRFNQLKNSITKKHMYEYLLLRGLGINWVIITTNLKKVKVYS